MTKFLATLFATAMLLAGCGDGDTTNTDMRGAEQTGAAEDPQTDGAPTEDVASPDEGESQVTLTVATTAHGDTVVDGAGRAVYVFDADSDGTSSCYEQCATNWPPLTVEGAPVAGDGLDAAKLGTTERTDGALQVTYGGRPLYYFAADQAPGDLKGHGVGDKWWLVRPDGSAIPKGEGAAY